MQDEINLAAYISPLLRRWMWIVGATVLGTLMGAVLVFTTPPVYEATAQVGLSTTSSSLYLPSASIAIANSVLPSLLQLTVLQSSRVADRTLASLGTSIQSESAKTLSQRVRVVNDPVERNLFRITAQAPTPAQAAAIANAWASNGAQEMNVRLFPDLANRTKQIQRAGERLNQTNQAVTGFLERNGLSWETLALFQAGLGVSPYVLGNTKPISLSSEQFEKLDLLLRDRQVAAQVYNNLSVSVTELKYAIELESGFQVLIPAVESTIPVQPKPTQTITMAAFIGLVASVLGVLALEYTPLRSRRT